MNEKPPTTVDSARVSLWLARAKANGSKCFICDRIAEQNGPESNEIRWIRISGIDLGPDIQISHLSRCVGRETGSA